MKKIAYLLLVALVGLGMTGCVQKKPRKAQTVKPKELRAQEIQYDFGYPSEDAAMLPTLNLDNMQKRAGEISLTNRGEVDLMIENIVAQTPTSDLFKMKNKCPQILKEGETCKVYVEYVGQKAGTFMQTYLVTSNDPAQPKLLLKAEAIAIEKMTVTDFSISNNVKVFLEDKSATNSDYYARFVFQNSVDKRLKTVVKSELDKVLEANAYKKNSSTFKSGKNITLYPNIEVKNSGENQYSIKVYMNGFISTKTSMKTGEIYHDGNTFITDGFVESNISMKNKNTMITTHNNFKNSDKAFGKEHFAFYLEIKAIDQKDKTKMYQDVAHILATTTVSVLGLEK